MYTEYNKLTNNDQDVAVFQFPFPWIDPPNSLGFYFLFNDLDAEFKALNQKLQLAMDLDDLNTKATQCRELCATYQS